MRDALLRRSAAGLPHVGVNWRTSPLEVLARAIEEARETWNFDVETAYVIDSWLAHYRGEL